MPCIFCIAALAITAATIVPALTDAMQNSLGDLATDLKRVSESDSAVMWSGSFAFKATDGRTKRAAANVTIYKESKRARIQVTTHEFSRADNEIVETLIAGALGAEILSRHDAHEAQLSADALQEVAKTPSEASSDVVPAPHEAPLES